MFLSRKFVYVDLPKTGTVSVLNWLKTLNVSQESMKHHLKPSEAIINSNRIKVATIRDPWSYYLSLWSYGCKKTTLSGPYNALTKFTPHKSRGWKYTRWGAIRSIFAYLIYSLNEDWSKNSYLYADANNPNLFQEWLNKLLNKRTATFLSGSYYGSKLHEYAGLYTYRYCNLYCTNIDQLYSEKLRNIKELKNWEKNNCYIDVFLQTNSLGKDFIDFMNKYRIITSDVKISTVVQQKMNTSKAKDKSVASFYNNDLINLVKQKEELIIQKFSYDFDNIGQK